MNGQTVNVNYGPDGSCPNKRKREKMDNHETF